MAHNTPPAPSKLAPNHVTSWFPAATARGAPPGFDAPKLRPSPCCVSFALLFRFRVMMLSLLCFLFEKWERNEEESGAVSFRGALSQWWLIITRRHRHRYCPPHNVVDGHGNASTALSLPYHQNSTFLNPLSLPSWTTYMACACMHHDDDETHCPYGHPKGHMFHVLPYNITQAFGHR